MRVCVCVAPLQQKIQVLKYPSQVYPAMQPPHLGIMLLKALALSQHHVEVLMLICGLHILLII